MITKIGLIEGEILTLLDKEKGPMKFSSLRSSLKETDYQIWMALGSLLCERYINAIETCATFDCQIRNAGKSCERESMQFIESGENCLAQTMNKESAAMARHIPCVTAEVLYLLKNFQGILSFETIVDSLDEPKEDILMAIGWLIRKGNVQSKGAKEIFITQLPKDTTDLSI